MGKYGHLGLYFGTTNYSFTQESGVQEANDVGIHWNNYNLVVDASSKLLSKSIFLKSDISIGETQYESADSAEKIPSHLFANLSFSVGLAELSERFNHKYEMGIGAGMRINSVKKDEAPTIYYMARAWKERSSILNYILGYEPD